VISLVAALVIETPSSRCIFPQSFHFAQSIGWEWDAVTSTITFSIRYFQ
jgi:hypothetical protein